jgi:hypothetical protein
VLLTLRNVDFDITNQSPDPHGLASPFRKGEGKGEGFCIFDYASFRPLNPLPCSRGEAGKTDAISWARAGLINVPEMALLAFC